LLLLGFELSEAFLLLFPMGFVIPQSFNYPADLQSYLLEIPITGSDVSPQRFDG